MNTEPPTSAGEARPPLRVLFESLSKLEGREEREAFLDFTCRDNPELRGRLERMLARHQDAEGFFDLERTAPAEAGESATGEAEAAGENEREGENTRIGRYRLIDRLGAGGCGVVYLAEQQEPVRRRFALKIIRLGMDTENVIARFEMERQALAMMDHPNIARVLDVGATSTGRPYFVMQLVDGEKITDYCDEKKLGIAERLRLFIRICQAVQHAHQKGVVHRDIKPSNILVWEHDGEAVPKVIDFGIAKATEAGIDGQVTFTIDGQFIGTPAYMSPEQASGAGLDVDTRSDIYGLGALLYELLCGQAPFDPQELREAGIEEIRHTLLEVEPPAPSTVVERLDPGAAGARSQARGSEPPRLVGRLKGDLDRIVRKAMAKDRRRRYSGADALAADITCFLNHEPVSARPPGGLYLLGKLVRRNKGVFVGGAAVFLSLVLGLGAATAMYFRANRAREAAEEARANEADLRRKAEIGSNIARAAVLVRLGNLGEADALISEIPPALAVPSLESADTFRALGLWHAREGEWDEAAKRFAALAYSLTSADPSDSDRISGDLLPAASALCEAGDHRGYERMRTMAAERFGDTTNPIVAEQVVKACSLRPASAAFLRKIAPLEELMMVEESEVMATDDRERHVAAWREFAIALIEFRRGNLVEAGAWLERCAATGGGNRARDASVQALEAMILQRQNRLVEAEEPLAAAAAIVEERFAEGPSIFDVAEPWWQDWINARLLVREAGALAGDSSDFR